MDSIEVEIELKVKLSVPGNISIGRIIGIIENAIGSDLKQLNKKRKIQIEIIKTDLV